MFVDYSQEHKGVISVPKTYIAFILDKSGSMNQIRDVAIRGFNDQLDSITREANPNTFVSLVTFSTHVTPIFFNRKVHNVPRLSYLNYQPDGWTALNDAIGYTISRLENESEYDPNTAFLVIIVSDGDENRSTDYTAKQIASLIKRKQDSHRWTFVYVGANQDLNKVAQTYNIPMGNMMWYESSPIGTANAFSNMSHSTANYLDDRKRGLTASTNFSGGTVSTTAPNKLDELINQSTTKTNDIP